MYASMIIIIMIILGFFFFSLSSSWCNVMDCIRTYHHHHCFYFTQIERKKERWTRSSRRETNDGISIESNPEKLLRPSLYLHKLAHSLVTAAFSLSSLSLEYTKLLIRYGEGEDDTTQYIISLYFSLSFCRSDFQIIWIYLCISHC